MRQLPSFTNKNIIFSTVNDDIISYVRSEAGHPKYLVILNVGSRDSVVDCSGPPLGVSSAQVVLAAGSSLLGISSYRMGDIADLQAIHLKSAEGVIFKI